MAPNTNQILFIVLFSLLAFILLLLIYVAWLKRMKTRAKRDILYEQHQLERQQQPMHYTPSQLQQLKPVLLQQLYDQDNQRQRGLHSEAVPQYTPQDTNANTRQTDYDDVHLLVNIHDESETDATVIHAETDTNINSHSRSHNPFSR